MMAGTFKPYNNNESDRISEELFDAFDVDDYDEREEKRSRASGPSAGRRTPSANNRKRRSKDRQLMVMVGMCVLGFLLIAEILCGIFLWKFPVFPAIAVPVMNLAIGMILGVSLFIAPILIAVVEIAAGVFAGQILLVVLGVILLAAAQIFCYAIR